MGTDAVFAADLHALRPQRGQAASASNLRRLLADSPIVASHKGPECTRVQDAYSLRCAPQVHGAARDTLAHAASVADAELASAVDNPVLTLDGRVESNGNFHGAPVALRARLPRDRGGGCRVDERAAHRPVPRPRPQPGPAAVPRARGRRRLGPHDRAVHRGGHRVGAEAARGAGIRRLDPVVGDAGGPRVDGLGRGAQAAACDRRAHAGARDRGHDRRARPRAARAARARARRPAPSWRSSPGVGAVPGPDRFLSPEIEAITELVASGAVAARRRRRSSGALRLNARASAAVRGRRKIRAAVPCTPNGADAQPLRGVVSLSPPCQTGRDRLPSRYPNGTT